MKVEFKTVKVLTSKQSTDTIILYTELPNGVYPYKGTATLEMKVASGKGGEYALKHFPKCFIEVINI